MYIAEVEVQGQTKYTMKDQMLIKVSQNVNEFYFMHEDLHALCGRKFAAHNIEIRYAFGYTIVFSLVTSDKNVIISCKFASIEDFQLFFSLIRATVNVQVSTEAVTE